MLWGSTRSAFVTTCGLLEIILSFPLGLFIWNVLMQQPYITYLMYNGLFVILGIGADDIFVLCDAFKQAKLQPPHISGARPPARAPKTGVLLGPHDRVLSALVLELLTSRPSSFTTVLAPIVLTTCLVAGSLETRFAWAYRRAAGAMLATSLTTAAAFASCAVSVIWDIGCFGVVAASMIVANYLLCITWLPAALVIQERYLADCCPWCDPVVIARALCGGGAALPPSSSRAAATKSAFATPGATPGASPAPSPPPARELTMGGGPAAAEADSDPAGAGEPPAAEGPRFLEEFFGGVYADWVVAHARPIVAFFTLLFVAAVASTALFLEPDTKQARPAAAAAVPSGKT